MEDNAKYVLGDVSIAIVDDHEVVIEGYRSYLAKHGINNVETFLTAHDLWNRVKAKHFDVYIVDVELPDGDVYSLIDAIRRMHPEARFVINTIHDEPWTVSKLSKKNVNGVVYKSGDMHQIIDALQAVYLGQSYYCGAFKKTQSHLQMHDDILTNRELDVINLIARGLSTKEISSKLFISENTVENHRKSIFRKLQVKNVAGLIVKAIALGYIDPRTLTCK